MKIVTAVVKLEKLDDVAHAVCEVGARGLTATEVRVLPKLRIDVLTTDELAWPVADAIAKSVNTGTIGDGKIWISPVESALRVRTGERDLAAL